MHKVLVTPAQAGAQRTGMLDTGLRRYDHLHTIYTKMRRQYVCASPEPPVGAAKAISAEIAEAKSGGEAARHKN